MKKLMALIVLWVGIALQSTWALSPKTVVIDKETATSVLQIKYPQGFDDKNIDSAIQAWVSENEKNLPADTPSLADAPGKNGLYIDYKTQFQNQHALSLVFNISSNTRGAAHPNNSISTLNFIDGKKVTLDQLFNSGSDYLTELATLSRALLAEKNFADKDWVKTGTEPVEKNYHNWYFTTNGLVIVFDTYQIAAYVYGPQTVEISKASLSKWLRPDVVKTVWGN